MKNLTLVVLNREKSKRESLHFGKPVSESTQVFGPEKSVKEFLFAPGSVFCVEQWKSNKYGTEKWELYILRAVWPGEAGNVVKGVDPGAEILLQARGKAAVVKIKKWLKDLSTQKDLHLISPDYFIRAHYSFKIRSHPSDLTEAFSKTWKFIKRGKKR